MRPLKLTAATCLAALIATGGIAYASSQFKQTSNIVLTAKKAGRPTGLKASLNAVDPGAVQPQGLKTLKITLPAGTKFNFASPSIKQCKAGDTELVATKGAACAAKSKIGSGEALANGAPVIPAIPETATAYAGKREIIFVLVPKGPAGQVLVLHGKVSKNVVTTQVPVISAGGLNVVITALNLTVKTIGSASHAFITAGRCAKGAFPVKSQFTYQTGESLTISSSSKCTG